LPSQTAIFDHFRIHEGRKVDVQRLKLNNNHAEAGSEPLSAGNFSSVTQYIINRTCIQSNELLEAMHVET